MLPHRCVNNDFSKEQQGRNKKVSTMKHFTTAVLERHTEYKGTFATEPYETAWASEAIFLFGSRRSPAVRFCCGPEYRFLSMGSTGSMRAPPSKRSPPRAIILPAFPIRRLAAFGWRSTRCRMWCKLPHDGEPRVEGVKVFLHRSLAVALVRRLSENASQVKRLTAGRRGTWHPIAHGNSSKVNSKRVEKRLAYCSAPPRKLHACDGK